MSSRSDDHMDGPLVTMTTSSWKSRKFVYNELVATEQDYIHDLRSIMHVSVWVCGCLCEYLGECLDVCMSVWVSA